MVHLLDSNVLIALFDGGHMHHMAVRKWFVGLPDDFATCPIVQGALVRWLVRIHGREGSCHARRELGKLADDVRHNFWPDSLAYTEIRFDGVIGHRQVSDAYLASLARKNGGRLATLDRGLAALHHDVADLIRTQTKEIT